MVTKFKLTSSAPRPRPGAVGPNCWIEESLIAIWLTLKMRDISLAACTQVKEEYDLDHEGDFLDETRNKKL